MGQNVNGKMFKNTDNNKQTVHPLVPLLFIVVLAGALIALNWFLIDFNTKMMEEQQRILEEHNATKTQVETQIDR